MVDDEPDAPGTGPDWGAETPLVTDLHPGRPLAVAFGGLAHNVGVPPFEFARLTASVDASTVLVRDLRQSWYQRGTPGLGDDAAAVAAHLHDVIASAAPSRVVAVGNSAGGFAAMHLGTLLGVDQVLAFSPQTCLRPWPRRLHRDRRWPEASARVVATPGAVLDLRSFLGGRTDVPPIDLHHPDGHRLDRWHATRLRRLPTVRLHPFASDRHGGIKVLRDSGRLAALVTEALEPSMR